MTRYQATILPLALESERQAQAAYTGGQTGLPALVQALQTARDTRQRGLQAGLDYQHALADLERAIGAPDPMTSTYRSGASRPLLLAVVRWSLALLVAGGLRAAVRRADRDRRGRAGRGRDGQDRRHRRPRSPRPGVVTPAPGAELTVVAPEAARIVELPKAEGDAVKAGDLLVRFDIPTLAADLGARQRGGRAGRRAARGGQGELHPALVAPRAGRRGAARSRRRQAGRRPRPRPTSSRHEARSTPRRRWPGAPSCARPFAGVVAKRFHNPGDFVEAAASDPVLRVINPSQLQVVATVPVADLLAHRRRPRGRHLRARPGRSRSGDGADQGRRRSIPAARRRTSGSRSRSRPRWRPARSSQVEIVGEERPNVLVIPAAALVDDEDEALRDGRRRRTTRRTSIRWPSACRPARMVEITSGLKAGDRVIVRGQDGLPEGAAITVQAK